MAKSIATRPVRTHTVITVDTLTVTVLSTSLQVEVAAMLRAADTD